MSSVPVDPVPLDAGRADGDEPSVGEARRPFSLLDVGMLSAAIVVAGLALYLISQVWNANDARDTALRRERHSYEVMLVARSVESAMGRSEAALGRFTASGDQGAGSAYYSNWVLAGSQIDKLRQLVQHDTAQKALIDQLDELYDARGKELGAVATRAFYKQGWPALVAYTNAGHSERIAQIDRVLDGISSRERVKLETRFDTSNAEASHTSLLIEWLTLAGIILVGAAGGLAWLAWSAVVTQRRTRAEAEAADDRAAELEDAVAERTRALRTANERLQSEMGERAAAEAQLRQIQKMEAVGQLTGGIAHDFNNMLAVVVGGLELAKRRLEQEADEVGRHIDNAMEGASRAAALTRRLLGFARAEPLLPEAIDPGALIAGMSEMIDRTLGERVTVRTEIVPETWRVWIDPLQLENAILNLAVNARDAMDGKGTLTIAVDNVVLGAGEIGEAQAGDHVRIRVTDSGAGMTPEVLERVFEPFFTTKAVGKGTGLGLSQIFGFVRQSKGEIQIQSTPGAGTNVSLFLPRSLAELAPAPILTAPHFAEPEPLPPLQREPVLVVEDDPRVRSSTVAVLQELGYEPVPCDSGEKALATLATRPDIRLMITDVVMPGMTGPELYAAVRVRRPDLGVLFVTGYAGEAGEGGELEGQAVLRKPFTVAGLARAVSDAFGRLNGQHPRPGVAAAE